MIGKMLIIFMLLACPVMIGPTLADAVKPPLVEETVIWELTKTTVVDPGETITTEEGILTTGYTIEARAKARSGSLIPEGTFRSTLNVFSPNRDMPGQKAGLWYVQGTWTITKNKAFPASLKARHNPNVVQGNIKAELAFNPATTQANWSGLASLPMSQAAGKWARGKGSITLDSKLEGDIFLDLTLWPEMR